MFDQSEIYPYRRVHDNKDCKDQKHFSSKIWTSLINNLKAAKLTKISWKSIVIILITFLLGRAMFFQELTPFIVPFIAVIELKRSRITVPMLIAGAIGLYSVLPIPVFWTSLVSILAMVIVMRSIQFKGKLTPYAVPPLVFASIVISKFLILAYYKSVLYSYVVVLIEAVVAAILAIAFMIAIPLLTGKKAPPKLAPEQLLSIGIFISGLLTGLAGLSFKGITLLGIMSKLIILLATYVGGTGCSTVVGTMVGLVPSIAQAIPPMNVSVYAFSGLFSGLFSRYGRVGMVLGLLLANIFLVLYTSGIGEMLVIFQEAAISVALFMLIPTSILDEFVSKTNKSAHTNSQDEKLARLTSQRVQEFATIFDELAQAVDEVSTTANPTYDLGWQMFLNQIQKNVCQGCSKSQICWDSDVRNTVLRFRDLLDFVDLNGEMSPYNANLEIRKNCLRYREILVAINCLIGTHKLGKYWQKRYSDRQELVSSQLKGVSAIMTSLAQEIDSGARTKEYEEENKWPLRLEVGVSYAAKDGSFVSGDNYKTFSLEDGKVAIILSDGMGVGQKATVESKATIALMEQLLVSGFDMDIAIKTVNSLLSLRGKEDTFATVDLAIIDLVCGECQFVKIGAAPSFVKRADKVGIIQSTSLPIGIIKDIDPDIVKQKLKPGDILIMTTDGLLESERLEQENWVIDVLKKCKTDDPQNLADYLLNMAGKGKDYTDDVLIFVTKIEKSPSYIS